MKYVTYSEFTEIYGGSVDENTFNILSFDACKIADNVTTGVDGVRKLKVAFPVTDEDDSYAVKRTICDIIHLMAVVKSIEDSANEAGTYVTDENGNIKGKVVSSVSAGSESIHFATGDVKTLAVTLANDLKERKTSYKQIAIDGFRGIKDENGVNLLYMGMYPVE